MSVVLDEEVTTGLKVPKKYNIFAINNDYTSFDEVVFILVQALNMAPSVAAEITREVDSVGRAKVNPKPMSKGLAEAQLERINSTKTALAQMIPGRKSQIMMLKFEVRPE